MTLTVRLMITGFTTAQTDQNHDHDRDRELVRALTNALVLAVGKRAARQALRHARAKAHPTAQQQGRPRRRSPGRLQRSARLHLAPAADVASIRSLTAPVVLGSRWPRGLTEAMGGTLEAEETPGGGLTMAISLPAAPRLRHARTAELMAKAQGR